MSASQNFRETTLVEMGSAITATVSIHNCDPAPTVCLLAQEEDHDDLEEQRHIAITIDPDEADTSLKYHPMGLSPQAHGLCAPLCTPSPRRRSRQIDYDIVADLANGSISSKEDTTLIELQEMQRGRAQSETSRRSLSGNGSIRTSESVRLRVRSLSQASDRTTATLNKIGGSLASAVIPLRRELPAGFLTPPRIKHPLAENVIIAAAKACTYYFVGLCYAMPVLLNALLLLALILPLRCIFYIITRWSYHGMVRWLRQSQCDPQWPLNNFTSKDHSTSRHHDPRMASASFCVVTVQGTLDPAEIRGLIRKKVLHAADAAGYLKFAQFSQKPSLECCGLYGWAEDSSFDINNHVTLCSGYHGAAATNLGRNSLAADSIDSTCLHVSALDGGSSARTVKASPKRIDSLHALEEYLNQLWGKAFSVKKAPWEVEVIPEFGDSRCTLLIFRSHSELAELLCLPKLLQLLNDDHSFISIEPRLNFALIPIAWSLSQATLLGPLDFTLCCLRPIFDCLRRSADASVWAFARKPDEGPRRHILTWARVPNFEHLLRLERLMHCSTAELLLSFIAGAFQAHFRAQGIKHPPDIEVSLPISVFDTCGQGFNRPNVRLPSSVSAGGCYRPTEAECNTILVPFKLPVSVEGCVPRVWEIQRRLAEIMEGPRPLFFWLGASAVNLLAPKSWTKRIFQQAHHSSSCVVSFYHASVDLNLKNHRIHSILNYTTVSSSAIACSFNFVHVGREVVLSLGVDQSIFPDPDVLLVRFQSEIQRLLRQVAGRLLSPLNATFLPVAVTGPLMAAKANAAAGYNAPGTVAMTTKPDETTPLSPYATAASSRTPPPPPLASSDASNDSSLEELESLLETVQNELETMRCNPTGPNRDSYRAKLTQFEQRMEALQNIIAQKLQLHAGGACGSSVPLLATPRTHSTPANIGTTLVAAGEGGVLPEGIPGSASTGPAFRIKRKRSRRTSSPTAVRVKLIGTAIP